MTKIEVLQPGLFSTIQDRGRYGSMKFGVPLSGPMDRYAAKLCNLLLQNAQESAVLEITQMGPKLKFGGPARIAICGAHLSPRINELPVQMNQPLLLQEGDILDFGSRKKGCRAYLGVSGGFLDREILHSKSWYEGITDHYRLSRGMKLHFKEHDSPNSSTYAAIKIKQDYLEKKEIIVFPGPEYHLLPVEVAKQLAGTAFTLDTNNNRMAIQLSEVLENQLSPILTGPVVPGTVQLTPGGKVIVLMRDCQTTGGYPRILQLSEIGINVLAQKTTGEKISFSIQADII